MNRRDFRDKPKLWGYWVTPFPVIHTKHLHWHQRNIKIIFGWEIIIFLKIIFYFSLFGAIKDEKLFYKEDHLSLNGEK